MRPLAICLCLCTLSLGTAFGAPDPVVQNGAMDGEAVDQSEGKGLLVTVPGWKPVNADPARGDRLAVEASDRSDAGQCLRIKTFGSDAGVYQTLSPLQQGTGYLVSAWVKRISGRLSLVAYPHAWGPAVMRRADESSEGWTELTIGLTPIDGGAHLYLVAAPQAEFLIDDVRVRVAPVKVTAPVAEAYDLGPQWHYKAAVATQDDAAREVLAQAVADDATQTPLGPPVKAHVSPGSPSVVAFSLPFSDGSGGYTLKVSDAATGEFLGQSTLVPQPVNPWDVRYPYKNALFGSLGYRWPLTVRVQGASVTTVAGLRAEVAIQALCGRTLRRFPAAYIGGGLRVPIDGSGLSQGCYRLQVRVEDARGREVLRETQPLRVLPAVANEVLCGPDGRVLAGGKAFFPLGMYWVFADPAKWLPGPDRADDELRELRACGINTLHSYAFEHNDANDTDDNALAYLDTAEEYGFKVLMGLRRDWYQGETFDPAAIETRVRRLMGHPALLAWTLWDEPNLADERARPRVKAMYDLIDRIDPYHPAMPVFAGPSAGGFLDCCDVLLYDNYPGPGGAAQVTQTMRRAKTAFPQKPVWFVAQAFRWPGGELPSAQDMRDYWRNALDEGAQAIFWYSYGGDGRIWDSVRQDDAHYERFQRINAELARRVGEMPGEVTSRGRKGPRVMGVSPVPSAF